MSVRLTIPVGYTATTARANSTSRPYAVHRGLIIADEEDVPDLIDQGFNFDNPVFKTLSKMAQKVNITDLVGDYTIGQASPGDLLLSQGSTDLLINIPAGLTLDRGMTLSILSLGTAIVTLSPAAGVTLQGNGTIVDASGMAQLLYLGSDTWYGFGGLS